MYAEIGISTLKPGFYDPERPWGRDALARLTHLAPSGFTGGYWFLEPDTGQVVQVMLFETREQAEAYGQTSEVQQARQRFATMALEGIPQIGVFEVIAHT